MAQQFVVPFPYKDTPGRVDVEVLAFTDGDPRFQMVDENGQARNQGVSLDELRRLWKSQEGDVIDPLVGLKHHVSLVPWVGADGQSTFIRVRFTFVAQGS